LLGAGGGGRGGRRGGGSETPTLASLNGQLGGLFGLLQGTDAAPAIQTAAAVARAERDLAPLLAHWRALQPEGDVLLRH